MALSTKMFEELAVVATIDPDAYTAAAYVSDYVEIGDYNQLMFIIMAGTLGTNATLDAKLTQATDSSGTSAKDVTGKAITQLTEAGTDSDKQAIITVTGENLDVANGFKFVALTMTIGTATSDAGAVALGIPRYKPATDWDLATVDEVV